MTFARLVALCFLTMTASAVEIPESIRPLTELTGDMQELAVLDGCVDLASGQYFVQERSMIIGGPDPLEISRSHSSGHTHYSEMGAGFGIAIPRGFHRLTRLDGGFHVLTEYRGQSALPLIAYDRTGSLEFRHLKETLDLGVTNIRGGQISAHTNPHQVRYLYKDWGHKHRGGRFEVSSGDGSKRYYAPCGSSWLLEREDLPSGNHRRYTFDTKLRLQRIETVSSDEGTVINYADFEYRRDGVLVIASDGQRAFYHLKEFARSSSENPAEYNGYYADWVAGTCFPTTTYGWAPRTYDASLFSFGKIGHLSGRSQHIGYDGKTGKVRVLSETRDEPNVYRKKYTIKYGKHITEVTDSLGEVTQTTFTKEKRVSTVRTNSTSEQFVWKGCLLVSRSLQDHAGNVLREIRLTYDSCGNVLKEEEHACISKQGQVDVRIKQYTYSEDRFNNLLSEHFPNGRKILYEYKPNTNLVTKKSTLDAEGKWAEITHLMYDNCAILISYETETPLCRKKVEILPCREIRAFGKPQEVRESVWQNEWKLQTVDHYEYNDQGLLARKTNDLGYESFEYDAKRRVTRHVNLVGQITEKSYDEVGNCTFEKDLQSGREIHTRYDLQSHPIEVRIVDGTQTLATEYQSWRISGLLAEKIDRFGAKTSYVYDRKGRVTSVEDYTGIVRKEYDALGYCTALVDQDGHRTEHTHNAQGQPLRTVYPDGSEESWEYDLDGNQIKHTACDGTATSWKYDSLGNCVEEKESQWCVRREFQGTLLVREDDQGRITEKEYNPAGLISEETIHGRRTSYFYDQHDRLVRTDHYEDSTSYISEEQKYDALDRIIEHSRSHSNGTLLSRTQSDYDSLGNLVRQRKWIDPTTIANTYQQFNALSELISSTDPLGLVTTYCVSNHNEGKRTDTRDPLGRVTRVQYDPASRPVLSQRFDANDALIAESWVKYDGRGHKTEQTDIRFDSTQPIDKYRVHWTYDARGRLIELAEPDRVYTYTYDSVGRLLTTTKPDGTVLTKAYSASGDLVSQRSSDGSIDVVYTYDDRQRLMRICDRTTQLTVTRAYSIHDEIVQEWQGPHLQTYTYDALGRCLVHTLPDGSEVHRSYRNGRLHSVRRGTWVHSLDQIDFCGHPLQSTLAGKAGKLFQTWDIQERPTSMLSNSYVVSNVRYNPVELLTGYFCKGPGGSFDFSASYDSWDQLCEERGRLTARYTLDSLGNRIQRDDQACSIGPSNQLLTCGDTDYTYDANGNRLTDGRFHYTYDALDRLVKVDTPTGTVTYRYDGLGRRLFRNDQRFLWSDECEIGSISHDGTLTSLRILASDVHLEVGSAVLVEINGTTFVPIHDLHGNCVVLMEAETGKVSGFANYSAYGEHTSSGTLGPWRFSSKRFDAVTGLHHFGGRDYDAAIGRWLTPDPMGFVDGPNLYAYVHNNPLTSIDSTGYCLDSFSDNTDYYLQRHWNETYRDNPIALARQQRAAGDMAARMFAGNTYDAITVGSSGAQLRKAIASDLAMLVPGGTAIAAFRVAKFCRAAQQISSVGHSTALTRRQLVATRFSTTVSPKVYCQSAAIDSVLANRGILSVRTKNLLPLKLDARALIRAGSEADRGGLTKAGRGLQKHGGRPGSIFTAPKGPVTVVNQTGIDRLHDIVSHSFRTTSFKELQRYGRVIDMHSPGLGGARFGGNGNFIGFLEP